MDRSWAGKRIVGGRTVMDSVANNATSHYLHNMFFMLGNKISTSAMPKSLKVELFRANDIETFDAIAAYFKTENDIPLYYYAAHSVEEYMAPTFEFHFENGIVTYDHNDNIIGKFNDGSIKEYGGASGHKNKILKVLDALNGGKGSIPCDLHTSIAHAKAMEMINERLSEVHIYSKSELDVVKMGEKKGYSIPGLSDLLKNCYSKNIIPGVEVEC